MEPVFSTACELAEAIRNRQVSSEAALNAHLAQIARFNPALNAIVVLDEAGARQQARRADDALAHGEWLGPLHGIPVTVKNLHAVRGLPSTWGGYPGLMSRIAAEDSAIPAKLRQAGAVLVGLTNSHFWHNNSFGRTNNPWNTDRSPNGSSGGSAAAVAAGLALFDIGNDSLASILGPAAHCGVFGMRPTEHRVANTGCKGFGIPHTWLPFTVQGPLTRSIEDIELVMRVISGLDGRDPDVAPLPWRARPELNVPDLRIAWASDFPGMTVAAEIRTAVEQIAQALGQRGVTAECARPSLDYIGEHQLAWTFMGFYWDEAFRANGWKANDAPAITLNEYRAAVYKRQLFTEAWEEFFTHWDALLCPVTATSAEYHDGPVLVDGMQPPDDENHAVAGSVSPLTGLPAVVIPAGIDREGLPLAVQIIGRRWDDERLLGISAIVAGITGGFRRPAGY
jgi:amidase